MKHAPPFFWNPLIGGAIRGRVTDPQQAAIPAVKVILQSNATGITREATTATDGIYAFPTVTIGSYTVTAEARGFKKAVAQNVQLDLAPEIGAVVESKAISDLPLNGRNFTQLMVLMAGSTERAGGGPIILPRYNGKNKSFIFGAYEGTYVRKGITQLTTIPTADQRNGSFGSAVVNDPFANFAPFPGNVIPAGRRNRITTTIRPLRAAAELGGHVQLDFHRFPGDQRHRIQLETRPPLLRQGLHLRPLHLRGHGIPLSPPVPLQRRQSKTPGTKHSRRLDARVQPAAAQRSPRGVLPFHPE